MILNITAAQSFFTEYYALFKQYAGRTLTQIEWDALVEETKVIDKKYGSEYCRELLLSLVNELERTDKHIKNSGGEKK
ncbi:cytochrome b involved in lipid metabolism [Aequitasia blattaphilus]|uniref:Uncharacterized protein n=1 Tax=Aequitasia blattaphilus TaxID=2949332 RepID=A0ABT1EH20_9FIRM|nr:hypothetical protein [Aequitasia blattaphilus]MCP1103732.1 hypothetical protein [Aequitasia blattaphilus]MCR8616372.1 hypothetical protein [Aequitasia blattaphilus]